jgi:hypothetical protein
MKRQCLRRGSCDFLVYFQVNIVPSVRSSPCIQTHHSGAQERDFAGRKRIGGSGAVAEHSLPVAGCWSLRVVLLTADGPQVAPALWGCSSWRLRDHAGDGRSQLGCQCATAVGSWRWCACGPLGSAWRARGSGPARGIQVRPPNSSGAVFKSLRGKVPVGLLPMTPGLLQLRLSNFALEMGAAPPGRLGCIFLESIFTD